MALKVFDGYGKIGLDTGGLTRGLDKMQRSVTGKMGVLGKIIGTAVKAVAVGVTAVAATISGVIAKSVFEFAKLEKGIAEITTLFGKWGKAANPLRKELTKIVQTLVTEFGQKTPEAIKATYDAVSAGIKEGDLGKFMEDAARLAVAGVTDIATSVDLLTSVMNAYGIEAKYADKVSGKLFEAVKQGKTTIGELGSALGQVAPTANAVGVSLDEMLSAMAVMTKQGISTSEAATALTAALSNILKPGKEAAELAEQLGLDFSTAAIKANGFTEVMAEIAEKTKGSDEQLTTFFGSVRAAKGVFALLSETGNKDFIATMKGMSKSSENTGIAFKEMQNTISFQMDKLKGNMTVVWQRIGSIFGDFFKTKLLVLNQWFKDNRQTMDRWAAKAKVVFEKWAEKVEEYIGRRGVRGALKDLSAWFDKNKKKIGDWLAEQSKRFFAWANDQQPKIEAKAKEIGVAVGKALWEAFSNFVKNMDWGAAVLDSIKRMFANPALLNPLTAWMVPATSGNLPSHNIPSHNLPSTNLSNMTLGPVSINVNSTAPAAEVGQAVAKALLDLQRVGGYSQGGVAVMP